MNTLRSLFSNGQSRATLTVITVLIGATLATLQARLFSVALSDLRGVFGLDILEAAWLSTVLNSAQLISMPIVPLLAAVIGATRVLVIPSLILALATLIIPIFTQNYPVLLVLHGIIGVCLGVYLPLTISLALRNLEPKFWLVAMAAYSLRISVGMDAGFGFSGFFVEQLSWHWIYWTTSIIAPLIALLAWKAIPLTPIERNQWEAIDWPGITLFCSGLVLVFIGLESAERLGWWDSGVVVSSLIGGAILFISAIIRALFQSSHFGNLIGLNNWNIGICMIIACLFGVLMTPTTLLIPNFIQDMGALKPLQVSTATFIAFGAYVTSIPMAIFLARRVEPRLLIIIGVTIIGVVASMGGGINSNWRTEQFVVMLISQALGESTMLIGLIAAFVTNIKPQHALSLGAIIPVARVMTPIVAGTLMTTWLRITGDISQTSLSAHVQIGDPNIANISLQGIAQILTRESHVLAYISGFSLVFWVSILSLLLASFLRSSPPNPITPPLVMAGDK